MAAAVPPPFVKPTCQVTAGKGSTLNSVNLPMPGSSFSCTAKV